MKYPVVLIESAEGFAVGCPAIPGCWSQGSTRAEALTNIQDAIREVVEVKQELEWQQWRDVETTSVNPIHSITRGNTAGLTPDEFRRLL